MYTQGIGYPVVVLPGIQGRWEWMRPTIEALGTGHRVITESLAELRPAIDSDSLFLEWMRAVDGLIERSHERKVSLVGVSFGGLIAACYAARRPDRVTSLILVSTPSPIWKPSRGDVFCARYPRLAMPFFGARAMRRLLPEIYSARETWHQRGQLLKEHLRRIVKAPMTPSHAAQWVREWMAYDISDECRKIKVPTLIMTGEPTLDRVVPVDRTLQYLKLIPGATHSALPGTGHIGFVSKPARFAQIAGQFIYTANTEDRQKPLVAARARHAS